MKRAFFFLVLIFLINAPGLYFQWYIDFWWFDVVLHFLGGFFMAMFLGAYLKEHIFVSAKIKSTLIIVGAAMFAGVTWEFAEYIANQTLVDPFYNYLGIKAYFMGDLADTVNDLMMDMLGSFTYALAFLSRTKLSADRQSTLGG